VTRERIKGYPGDIERKERLGKEAMRRILRRRPSPATAVALAALIVALGGVAYATIPDSSGTIHGCSNKANGNLRVVESNCRRDETAIAWNQRGPPGPPGEATGLRRFGQVTVPLGESKVLLEAGPLTFSADCMPTIIGGGLRPQVNVVTSEDHAAVAANGSRVDNDLNRGETATVSETVGFGTPGNVQESHFAAFAVDGTDVSGILSVGGNLVNKAGCIFGGHAVIGGGP
jgi:hypothetical protein